MPLPPHGRPADEVLAELDALQGGDVDWKGGRVFSLAYFAGDEIYGVARAANDRLLSANALNTAAFPSLKQMEADVVATVAGWLGAPEGVAGSMTTGGTESLVLTVLAARERGRQMGITEPNMVLPLSAHAAFEKGAHYFDVRSVRVPVGDDFRADPDAMAAAMDENTVLVAASAPQYPQGAIDPVEEIAALAAARDVNCHVDACMGGVVLPYLRRLGEPIPPFDFSVDGVTSMSIDLHKYGYTAKGASVLLHRDRQRRRHQTFVTDNWTGGLYGSTGVLGTKSGGPIAAAWAVLQHVGDDGYLELARVARDAQVRLRRRLDAIEGVSVLGDTPATLVAFGVDGADPFAVADLLAADGWYVDRQGPPPSLHCTVHAGHAGTVEAFADAVEAAVASARASAASGEAGAYGTLD
ncbi:pyridoxal phosphate-dependent decarboxylase family protein [Actinomarinicola tropica]|uniref:Aminotransferase class V-fold PLP-dependent enzyme n=1 Tax=Actinomarinicola tropica TaxID=2789776 RepID=A0A5Q2RDN9_9ACTN|nr:aminotransferase class V-fold PLP-dependent enzyme [Actinomarinicola tropica]QGG93763.1 aminotransferase class V-fold PLP-dependent enzyme [Actinomarinicola tropica]